MGGDSSAQLQTSAPLGKADIDSPIHNHNSNGYAMGPGEGSSRSASSTPEGDLEHEPDHEPDQKSQEQPQQQQKRKGGRKPIYATSEERKQRNRQAQAAFRERRTEYIKQLESTIKVHEENLQSLQASHRTAADECLMLRYKNSLLERILIEKGIDVQAELRAKTGSPGLIPTRVGPPPPSAPSGPQGIARFPINKFANNRRSLSAIPTKDVIQLQDNGVIQTRSPLSQPTTTSHLASPIAPLAKSPNFIPQTGAISPSFGPVSQQNPPLRPQQSLRSHFAQQRPTFTAHHPLSSAVSSASGGSNGSVLSGASSAAAPRDGNQNYYPSPFQNHYDQLEQEYDAEANMLDDDDAGNGVPAFPTNSFAPPQIPQHGIPQHSPIVPNPNTSQASPLQAAQPEASGGAVQGQFANGAVPNGMFDPFDPMLDADPFGLSASMHFPTQYTYEQR